MFYDGLRDLRDGLRAPGAALPVADVVLIALMIGHGGEARMISRVWHGWTTPEDAGEYERMLRTDILPGIHRVPGYQGAYLFRRDDGMKWSSLTFNIFAAE